jgi:hypothetical protein
MGQAVHIVLCNISINASTHHSTGFNPELQVLRIPTATSADAAGPQQPAQAQQWI